MAELLDKLKVSFIEEESAGIENFLMENRERLVRLFDEVLNESGQVEFSFSELLEEYDSMGTSFVDLILDILDSYDRQGEGDWQVEDAVLTGSIDMGIPIGLQ